MQQQTDLPRLPPWEIPQVRINKHTEQCTVEETNLNMNNSSSHFTDPRLMTPLNYKNERKSRRALNTVAGVLGMLEDAPTFKYDPSPFIVHDNILNKTKVDQLKQQEIAMRRVFDMDRSVPESRVNTTYYHTLWREQRELMDEEVPETSPRFGRSRSSQDLYKQLRQFQTAFVQSEAWKYEEHPKSTQSTHT